MTSRLAEVDPERLAGWVDRFAASHGAVEVSPLAVPSVGAAGTTGVAGPAILAGTHPADRRSGRPVDPADGPALRPQTGAVDLRLVAGDGAVAELELLWPVQTPLRDVDGLAAAASAPRTAAVLLVRRGGWAAGVVRDGRLLEGRTGTRYVQSRTAAGGWSQQRYARRRDGQAAELVAAAVAGARQVATRPAVPEVLAVGGDRALVTAVLADPALAGWARLARSPLLDVADPRRAVLDAVATRVRRVRVTVTDP